MYLPLNLSKLPRVLVKRGALYIIGAIAGISLGLDIDPPLVLRYAAAAASFGLARELAACPRCANNPAD